MHSPSDFKEIINSLTEQQWKNLYLEHARGERSDVVPFPSAEIQVITNNQKGEVTAHSAISILDCIMSCVHEISIPTKGMRVLDYGCGWGRITRLLPYYFNAECVTGVDVDEHLIKSANELLPYIKHIAIKSMKKLPFEDNFFDIVFANSVFSHLSEKACLFTLSGLSKILRRGGILIISVLEQNELNKFYSNEGSRDWVTKILGDKETAIARLQQKGFVWGDTKRWHEYGIAIMSDSWIAKRLEAVGIQYHGTKHTDQRGSQNYKIGTKVTRNK